MAEPLVSDDLWERIEPLLPPPKRRRRHHSGRKPIDRRKVLTGIIFVLKTGIPWEELPQEMGCGCGMTCWNYLHGWQRAGVWDRLHEILLNELQGADRIGRERLWTARIREPWEEEKKPAKTLRIAASWGPSTTSSRTVTGCLWP